MARTRKRALGLAVLVPVTVAAAGCGSGGGGSDSTTVAQTVTAPGLTTTKPVSTTPEKGFTQSQWKHYRVDAARFTASNKVTLARLAVCAKPSNPPAGAVQKCVGDSLDGLSAATTTLGATLAGFANSVGGSCQQALGSLIAYVVPYEAKIALLEKAIAGGDPGSVRSELSSMKAAQADGQAAADAVEQSCQ